MPVPAWAVATALVPVYLLGAINVAVGLGIPENPAKMVRSFEMCFLQLHAY